MYSLMSMRTMACSSSNRNSASALASSVLPTPVGPRNRNEPIGRFGSLEPGAGAADGVGDGVDRLVLADDALVQPLLHVDELLELALHELGHRDAGPRRDDLGDVVGRDLLPAAASRGPGAWPGPPPAPRAAPGARGSVSYWSLAAVS